MVRDSEGLNVEIIEVDCLLDMALYFLLRQPQMKHKIITNTNNRSGMNIFGSISRFERDLSLWVMANN